jgi:hypothetical protein
MGLAFGGKELVDEEDPNLNLRKIHYHLIRDKGLSLVSEHAEVMLDISKAGHYILGSSSRSSWAGSAR